MKLQKFLNWRAWFGGLWTSFIQGGCAAILGSTGLVGANLVGANVKPLELSQAGAMFLSAALVRMLFYLSAHTLPEEITEQVDQEIQNKPPQIP